MSKVATLTNRLQASNAALEQGAEELAQRKNKALAASLREVIEQNNAALASAESGTAAALFRLAKVTNPKTNREVTVYVNKAGEVPPSYRATCGGVERADEWVEVRADSFKQAREAMERGEGEHFQRTKKA